MSVLNRPLSEIIRQVPGATQVFRRHGVSVCAQGDSTVSQLSGQVNKSELMAELQMLVDQLTKADDRWEGRDDLELIEHILTRYHDVHRQQLPELIRLSQRVERVHGGHPACPTSLSAHLESMKAELETHMGKEERILFPMISRGMRDVAVGPVQMMRREHEDHDQDLAQIRHLTHNLKTPEGACNTWQALYAGLRSLEADLLVHMHLENDILFARVEQNQGEVAHG